MREYRAHTELDFDLEKDSSPLSYRTAYIRIRRDLNDPGVTLVLDPSRHDGEELLRLWTMAGY